jgi:Zn-dependent protease
MSLIGNTSNNLVSIRYLWDKSQPMADTAQGSFRLFRVLGISVFLHWSWFLVALFQIQNRSHRNTSILWSVMEYLGLFVIVLLHEFGHALACRRVGGKADHIILWPLGGIAYVSPPQRPGAMLWSIAAGPLVNVALFFLLGLLLLADRFAGYPWPESYVHVFLLMLWIINIVILVFNLLPIYPLDGGQILRSLLWYKFGRANSLMIAAIVGLFGVVGLLLYALWTGSVWTGILAVFILMNCWRALSHVRTWARLAKAPQREDVSCPKCKAPAPRGAFWLCPNCRNPFDPFALDGSCLHCKTPFAAALCQECGVSSPMSEWIPSENIKAD